MQLTVEGINKSFGQKKVLKDISFTAKSGFALGLLGRNGSGKTTTIRIIMDIFEPDSGNVTIDGISNRKSTVKIGYLPEERGLYPKRNILEQMVYFGELKGMKPKDAKESAERLLKKLNAEEYLKKRLDTLSKGNQQKIQLAIALINNPDIIVLDEPFSGLDPVNAKILKDIVSDLVRENKVVLFSSHQMSNVEEFCDDICIINNGTIVLSGSLRSIKKTYPRNKVLLVPENEKMDELAAFLAKSGELKTIVSSIEKSKKGCIITLTHEEAKSSFMHFVAGSDISIDSFSIMEPTLEEIFVEKAGDIDAAV